MAKAKEKGSFDSPEPLLINPKMVAVDLMGTLVKDGTERPGATWLLNELNKRGFSILLMSSLEREEGEGIIQFFPAWKNIFAKKLFIEDINGAPSKICIPFQQAWLEKVRDFSPAIHSHILDLLYGLDGGKYPPLWGASILIDDSAVEFEERPLPNLKEYGFIVIDAKSSPAEDAKAWAERVLGEVDAWRATQN